MSGKWNVWSIDDRRSRALVVDEGPQKYALASAERRNTAAAKYDAHLRFEALPGGQVPTWLDEPTWTDEPAQPWFSPPH